METLVLITHLTFAFFLIVVILLQQGKGADTGASFGSGASQTVFGGRGSTSFMIKITSVILLVLLATSIGLSIINKKKYQKIHQGNINLPETGIKFPSMPNIPGAPKSPSADMPQIPGSSPSIPGAPTIPGSPSLPNAFSSPIPENDIPSINPEVPGMPSTNPMDIPGAGIPNASEGIPNLDGGIPGTTP